MKYFLIAGERSGDLHGGNLIKELKKQQPDSQFTGFGGDNMSDAGMDIKVHYRDLAFMGFLEVLQNIFTIRAYINQCKREIDNYKPDAIILIDYAGFNMKIAKYAKRNNIPVHYYISPKVWAWNQKRALKLKKLVDYMYVILPFEKDFYKKFHWEVSYVGNPVLDAVKSHQPSSIDLPQNYVALLPGSRKQELQNVIPVLYQLAKSREDLQFAVATVDNLDPDLYGDLKELKNVNFFKGSSYDLLSNASAAVVTSGTATLETALWKVPQVVIYKTSSISYAIAKHLIRVPYISLVNLIANKEVVKELIQNDLNIQNIDYELNKLLSPTEREIMLKDYKEIIKLLDIGSASRNAAEQIIANSTK